MSRETKIGLLFIGLGIVALIVGLIVYPEQQKERYDDRYEEPFRPPRPYKEELQLGEVLITSSKNLKRREILSMVIQNPEFHEDAFGGYFDGDFYLIFSDGYRQEIDSKNIDFYHPFEGDGGVEVEVPRRHWIWSSEREEKNETPTGFLADGELHSFSLREITKNGIESTTLTIQIDDHRIYLVQ